MRACPRIFRGIFVYMFFSPVRNDPRNTHRQTTSCHPVPGPPSLFVFMCFSFPERPSCTCVPLIVMLCAEGIFAKGILGCTGFSLLLWEKGSETPSCDGEKGLRLPRSSCSDLGNEEVSDPFPHRKSWRESQTLFPTAKGKPRTSQNPLSENPRSATHDIGNLLGIKGDLSERKRHINF